MVTKKCWKYVEKGLCSLVSLSLTIGLSGCAKPLETTPPQEESQRTEIEYWYAGGKTAVKVMSDIVDAFNASQDDYIIKPTVKASYDETFQSLQAALAGNVAPDLALLEIEPSRYLADRGILENIGNELNDTPEFRIEDFTDVFINASTSKDQNLYMFPAYGTTQVFYYNREAFKKAGVHPESIHSWQDLVAKKDQFKAVGIPYIWEPMWGSDNLIDVAFSNGATMFSDDGKNVTIDTPEWIDVFESFRKWIHDDKIMTVHSGGQGWEYWYKTMDDAVAGTAAGYTGSSGDQADLDFAIVGAMEQPGFHDHIGNPTAESKEFVMPKNTNEKEKAGAAAFVRFFTNPEQQALWSIGTGYVPVRKNMEQEEMYKEYVKEHPEILVPVAQSQHASSQPIDPTGGKIYDALKIAADQIELENIPAEKALKEAQRKAQKALDEVR